MRILILALLFPLTAFADWNYSVVNDEPVITNADPDADLMVSLTAKDRNCGVPLLSIGNYLPDDYEVVKPSEGQFRFAPSFRFGETVAPMPPQAPRVLEHGPTGKAILIYQYVPSDRMLFALMNHDTFYFKDPMFKEDLHSTHANSDFIDMFNRLMVSCFEMFGEPKSNDPRV